MLPAGCEEERLTFLLKNLFRCTSIPHFLLPQVIDFLPMYSVKLETKSALMQQQP